MTAFRPCFGCTERNDCEIKKSAVSALRGVPITLAKIKCDLPWTQHFPPGTRALVKVWDHSDDHHATDDYESDVFEKMVPATVVGKSSKKAGKLLLHLDAKILSRDGQEIEFRAAWPKEIQRLDEPRADYCGGCNRAFVNSKCSCPDYDDGGF